jgi:hypothetical protein
MSRRVSGRNGRGAVITGDAFDRPELANSVEKLTVGMIFSNQQFLETMFLSGYCPFFY